MSFLDSRRERFIRSVLRGLSRQRVVSVLQPGNVLLVERALEIDDDTTAALRTCHLRGWVEPVTEGAIPRGRAETLTKRADPLFDRAEILYRLTDSGWNVIHDSHSWVVGTFVVSVATLVASIVGVLLAIR